MLGISCDEIEGGWPDQAGDLSLDIRATDEPGVFEASFDFGILEGVMIMSTDKKKLEEYCSQLGADDSDEYDDEDEDEEEVEDDYERKVETGSKRKSNPPPRSTRPRPPTEETQSSYF
ncbi:hypothetical protein CIB48_g11363 [Xylaria polymorpha]|nr:hypothetical protein CIB48_g11363 [Xylaria polymorpha]